MLKIPDSPRTALELFAQLAHYLHEASTADKAELAALLRAQQTVEGGPYLNKRIICFINSVTL